MKWAETAPDTVTIIDKQHTTHKTMIKKYIFETRMEVRDYECDIQGIVNNANYLHYTEHDIFRASDERLCFRATVELAVLINGRLGTSDEYDKAFAPYLNDSTHP